MIRHIVFFSIPDPANLAAVMDGLAILGTIPGVMTFEVARNLASDRWSGEVDIVVYAEFADAAALEAYRAHPTYAESIRRVRPLRDLRIAADMMSAPAG